jgi:hypothetical protein
MVFNLTHSQLILRYKEKGGRIEPYTIVIMVLLMISIVYGSPAAGSGNKWAATIGGLGR